MRCITAIGIAAVASLPAIATPARAEIEYPWCAQYSGKGGTNCGFSTLAVCGKTWKFHLFLFQGTRFLVMSSIVRDAFLV